MVCINSLRLLSVYVREDHTGCPMCKHTKKRSAHRSQGVDLANKVVEHCNGLSFVLRNLSLEVIAFAFVSRQETISKPFVTFS